MDRDIESARMQGPDVVAIGRRTTAESQNMGFSTTDSLSEIRGHPFDHGVNAQNDRPYSSQPNDDRGGQDEQIGLPRRETWRTVRTTNGENVPYGQNGRSSLDGQGSVGQASVEENTQQRSFHQRLLYHFQNDIFLTKKARDGSGKGLVISFAGLQRMRLRKLQGELANQAMQMHFEDKFPSNWETLLKEYTQAVRDYDFIKESVNRPDDPFIITTARELEAEVLRLGLSTFSAEKLDSKGEGWSTIDIHKGNLRDQFTRGEWSRKSEIIGFWRQLTMAVFGGLFLVAPMWLMVLDQRIWTGLISTTVFVFAFAIVMAVLLRREPSRDIVMTSTAAYAAVLVVFVGTTTGSGGS